MAPPQDVQTDQQWREGLVGANDDVPPSGEDSKTTAERLDSGETVDSSADDWLDDLRASADDEVRPEPVASPGGPGSPDLEDDSEPTEPVDIPDWLSSMGPIAEGREDGTGVPSDGAFRDGGEWLPPEEVPSERSPAEERPFTGLLPEEPPLARADIPQWLREYAPDAADAQAEPASALDDDEMLDLPEFPDWLRDLGPIETGTPTAHVEELPTVEESIAQAGRGMETRRLAPAEGLIPGDGWEPEYEAEADWEAGPEWLREIEFSPDLEETPHKPDEAQVDEPISTAIRIPDWLKEGLEPEVEPAAAVPEPDTPVLAEEQLPAVEREPAGEASAADSDRVEPAGPVVTPEVGPEAVSAIDMGLEELPLWLRDEDEGAESEVLELEIPAPDLQPSAPTVPDWLAEILAEPPAPAGEGVPSTTEASLEDEGLGMTLERAQIPEWLQDMRPADTEERATVAGALETDGLLQGLLGLLPSTFVVRIPPSHRAQPSALPDRASLARAELLQSLLGQPIAAPLPVREERRARGRSAWGRRVVAMVLLVVILGTQVLPLVLRGVPPLSQPVITLGSQRLYQVVGSLSAGDEVLVAFDYGAPEADELNVAARPVLQHVIDQGVHVTVVSTRPDGTVVASALMREIAGSASEYVVLNYRPGAAPAVSHLLTAVERTPTLLLVLTSRVAPLRRWVELARVHYGDQLPVALVGSAALEPVASPYVDGNAGQVSGHIHGLRGAASYESLRGTGGDATQRLNALAAGHLAVILLMVLGSIYHGLARFQRGNS
ncbi:MAG: hypothetical protein PVH41_15735 [Anaerolineae bacterium]